MNGSILGMTRHEINSKFDEIIDFAGIERYIDTPVKRYSSGMTVRLGFAVAAFLDPEILVVDEVLAVGDAEFQKKAIGKMQDVSRGEGRTVLFVSHNMSAIRSLCERGILLDNGMVYYDGTVSDTIGEYLRGAVVQSEFEGIDGVQDYLYIRRASLESSDGQVCYTSSKIIINLEVVVVVYIPSLVIGYNIVSSYQYPLARADYNNIDGRKTLDPGIYQFRFEIPPYTLAEGDYQIAFDVAVRNVKCYSTELSKLSFSVSQGEKPFGNIFADSVSLKRSIIQEKWDVKWRKLDR